MNAQELINSCKPSKDNMKFFYPDLYKQKKADKNITKCLSEMN